MLSMDFNNITEIKKRQEMLVYNIINTAGDYCYHQAGPSETSVYGGSYEYTEEEQQAEIRENGKELIFFAEEIISHQGEMRKSDNAAIKAFRAAEEADFRLTRIYNALTKIGNDGMKNPQQIVDVLKTTGLMYTP